MPGITPVATSEVTSLAAVLHPTTTPVTASGPMTAPNVTFNGIPPVLAGDTSCWHTFVIGKVIIWHPGYAYPTQITKTVNGRPIIKVGDPYVCFCGLCMIKTTMAPNITIGV